MSKAPVKHRPHNAQAEKSVLGSILIEPDLMNSVDLTPEDFYVEAHRAIYQAMASLWNTGHPIDYTLLADELERAGQLGDVVKPGDLTALMAETPTGFYGEYYASVVKRASVARQYIRMADKLAQMAFEEQDADTLYSWIMEQIAAINSGQADDKALLMWAESFEEFQRILERNALRKANGQAGWSWPWAAWDNMLGEPQPGGLVLVAGATGTGKTIFAENIAEHWARLGKKVVLVHLELNRAVMLGRRMARHTGIPLTAILAGKVTDAQRRIMRQADEAMQAWAGNIHYLHAPGWSSERIVKELSRLHEVGQCDGFVVDYLQKIQVSPTQMRIFRGSGAELKWVADDVERLKNLAEQRELIACLLSQFTKEGQELSLEQLHHTKLRGTQEIPDKVNQICLIHRAVLEAGRVDDAGRELVPPGGLDIVTHVKVTKNTFGPMGILKHVMTPDQFRVSGWE